MLLLADRRSLTDDAETVVQRMTANGYRTSPRVLHQLKARDTRALRSSAPSKRRASSSSAGPPAPDPTNWTRYLDDAPDTPPAPGDELPNASPERSERLDCQRNKSSFLMSVKCLNCGNAPSNRRRHSAKLSCRITVDVHLRIFEYTSLQRSRRSSCSHARIRRLQSEVGEDMLVPHRPVSIDGSDQLRAERRLDPPGPVMDLCQRFSKRRRRVVFLTLENREERLAPLLASSHPVEALEVVLEVSIRGHIDHQQRPLKTIVSLQSRPVPACPQPLDGERHRLFSHDERPTFPTARRWMGSHAQAWQMRSWFSSCQSITCGDTSSGPAIPVDVAVTCRAHTLSSADTFGPATVENCTRSSSSSIGLPLYSPATG